ncbi:MAG: hypothetical protein UIC64_10550 [Agathobacter sp.]|nr:hypothetical protein [Agathobacter sp.]
MLRRINESLPELVIGIVIYGVVLQLGGIWFVSDKIYYSIGLWVGIFTAIGMAINIAIVLQDSIGFDGSKAAKGRIVAKSAIRYIVVVVLFFILGYFKLGNLIAAFLGVLGLKISAYMQPLIWKVTKKDLGRNDAAPNEENSIS